MIYSKILKSFIIIFLSCVVCFGCDISMFIPEEVPLSEWMTKWLEDPTCQIPCWEGLTPGVTQIDDGAEILRNKPFIKTLKNPIYGPVGDIRQISWEFENQEGSGVANSDENGEIIAWIALNTGATDFPLKKVIASYGYPDWVSIYCQGTDFIYKCSVELVIKDKGMILGLLLDDKGKPGNNIIIITPESQIEKILLFANDQNRYETAFKFSEIPHAIVYDWKGYSRYP